MTLFPCVRPGEQEVSKEFFTNDVSELLDYLMKEGTEQIGKAPEEMTKEEKKQVISYLDQKGALLITKSGPKNLPLFGNFQIYAVQLSGRNPQRAGAENKAVSVTERDSWVKKESQINIKTAFAQQKRSLYWKKVL